MRRHVRRFTGTPYAVPVLIIWPGPRVDRASLSDLGFADPSHEPSHAEYREQLVRKFGIGSYAVTEWRRATRS